MFRKALVAALALGLAGGAAAGVYKWVDEQGKVHYGDRPPAVGVEELDLPEAAPAPEAPPASSAPSRQRLLDNYREEREQKKQAAQEQKQQRDELETRCRAARDRLAAYQGSNLYETLPDGERRYLTREEQARAIADLERDIKRFCGR